MSRLFDPIALLNDNIGTLAPRRDPLPMGETTAQIMETTFAQGNVKKAGPNFGKPWARLDVKLEITDPEYVANIPGGIEKATTTLGVMLDLTENGSIATGPNKNIRLGRLMDAAGVNGKPISALAGNYIRIQIGHKPHPSEPDVVLDEIVGYTKV
jgi:hypothetical protein